MHGPLLKVNPRHCVALQLGIARGRVRCRRASMTASSETRRIDRPLHSRRNGSMCARVKVKPHKREGKTRYPSWPPPLPALLTYNRRQWRTILVFPKGRIVTEKSLRSRILSTLWNINTKGIEEIIMCSDTEIKKFSESEVWLLRELYTKKIMLH